MLFDTRHRKKRRKKRIEVENEMCFFFFMARKSEYGMAKEKKIYLKLTIDEYKMNIIDKDF
jgi:hypothetical protein